MKAATAAALGRINEEFYERHAEEFSRSRAAPWPGWARVVERLRERRPATGRSLSVLDAGCGNGRLAGYLGGALDAPLVYVGVDSCDALLDIARRRAPEAELARVDLAGGRIASLLPAGPFDLVTAFGLLHHVPGSRRRRRLLAALASRVAPGGLLALSFWQFAELDRFRRRLVPWEEARVDGVDQVDLERGDLLLAWGEPGGNRPRAVRYCHYADPDEAAALIATLDLEPVDRYRADGRGGTLNLYFLLGRSRGRARGRS